MPSLRLVGYVSGMEPTVSSRDLMRGFPPPRDQRIRFADGTFYQWPQLKWSFAHMEQLVPTKAAWRGSGPVCVLEQKPVPFEQLRVRPTDGEPVSFDTAMEGTNTDALAVIHRGALVHESYRGHTTEHTRHIIMSCNKSLVGMVAECLIADGLLTDDTKVIDVLPEVAGSAWEDATLRHVLDMTVGMEFHEDYLDPESDVWVFLRSTGMLPSRPGDIDAVCDFLPTIRKAGDHGDLFAYREPNIFLLGWLLRRATNSDIASQVSERIWQHIGAEHDYLFTLDASGAEATAMATLRDFARFGQFVLDTSDADDHVLPRAAVESVLGGGDQSTFARGDMAHMPDWSYRSQWWIRHLGHRICPVARGAHGQMLYLDPANELVIARFGSSHQAPSALLDPIMWPLVDALTEALTA